MAERRDLVILSGSSWGELSSSERINLRSVELAFVALQHSKPFKRALVGRGISPDEFLTGVTSLEVLTNRIDELFYRSLSDKMREKLGCSILEHVVGDGPRPSDLNGDTFVVKEQLRDWVKRDFAIEKKSSKE